MVEPGDWTGPGRRAADPRPQRHRRRGARDGPRRHPPARRRLRIERRERADQRLLRPPRPPGHPHAARAGRGQGDDLPDHASPMAGSCSTPTTRSSRRSPGGSAAQVAFFSLRRPRRRATVRRHRAQGGRAYLVRPRAASSRPTARPTTADRRGRRDPDHDRRAGAPQRRQRPGGGRRRARRSARPIAAGRATGCATSGRPPSGRPGRLNLFRLGSRVVIVDFAHNEAGHRGGPGRRRGDRRRRRGARPRRSPRSSAPPATGPTTRCAGSAGSPPSAPSGSRSRRRSSTSAAGRASRSSASCWPASRRPACRPRDVPVYDPRPRRSGPSSTAPAPIGRTAAGRMRRGSSC